MKVYRLLVLALVLSLLLGAPASSFVHAQSGEAPPTSPASSTAEGSFFQYLPMIRANSPLRNLFGYENFSITSDNGDLDIQMAGATRVRRNALLWSAVEPNWGDRNWDAVAPLEQELKNAASLGLDIVLVVRGVPGWAQRYAGFSCGPIASHALEAFSYFMHDLVARYSVAPYYVMNYELWNEPDVDGKVDGWDPNSEFGCWGDVGDRYYGGRYYGEMLKWVYPKVKQANASAQVLVGGLLLGCTAGNCGKPAIYGYPYRFLEGILVSGAGNSLDGVAFHAYDGYMGSSNVYYGNSGWQTTSDVQGPVLNSKSDFLRGVLNSYGFTSKYLINTEVALICGDQGVYIPACHSPEYENTKAIYLTQAYAAAYSRNLRANLWYSLFGWRSSALMEPDTKVKLPAFNAYEFAAQMMGGASSGQEISLGTGIKAIELAHRTGKVWVAWSLNDTLRTIALPAGVTEVWRWNSASSSYEPASFGAALDLTFAPVYIKFLP